MELVRMNDPVPGDETAPVDRWAAQEKAAIAICMTGIGSWPVGGCVCARDGRKPSRAVPRCCECLVAAIAAQQIFS